MDFSDIDLSELPPKLSYVMVEEKEKWESYYPPEDIMKDAPFNDDWVKFVYWIPRIKRKLYVMAISRPEFEMEDYLYNELGMDRFFFHRNYRAFIKRLDWMRDNYDYSHLGEI